MKKKKSQPGIGFEAENSQANSKPTPQKVAHLAAYLWPKDKSGNPGGRAKNTPFTTAMKELAEANPQAVRAIAITMYEAAQNRVEYCNPVLAAKFITHQVEGPPVQRIAGADGGPIQVEHGSRDENAARIRELAARAVERANRRRTSGVRSEAAEG